MSTTSSSTWPELIVAEPRLVPLLAAARRVRDPRHATFCRRAVWLGAHGRRGFRRRVDRLILPTEMAYRRAAEMIYAALPPCRQCACVEGA